MQAVVRDFFGRAVCFLIQYASLVTPVAICLGQDYELFRRCGVPADICILASLVALSLYGLQVQLRRSIRTQFLYRTGMPMRLGSNLLQTLVVAIWTLVFPAVTLFHVIQFNRKCDKGYNKWRLALYYTATCPGLFMTFALIRIIYMMVIRHRIVHLIWKRLSGQNRRTYWKLKKQMAKVLGTEEGIEFY